MNISESTYKKILNFITCLTESIESKQLRSSIAPQLLDLLQADYFASYVWDADKNQFVHGIHFNMDPDSIRQYESYYQFHDPITYKLQKFKVATSVNQVITQSELSKTEFFNDFLASNGLCYGINLYSYDGAVNTGDLRIWRSKNHQNFTDEHLYLLNIVGTSFCNTMNNLYKLSQDNKRETLHSNKICETSIPALIKELSLTSREAEIAIEISSGKSDQEILSSFYISFNTLRTHIKNIYCKLNVHNRTALSNLIQHTVSRVG